jgi:hypothetical protein
MASLYFQNIKQLNFYGHDITLHRELDINRCVLLATDIAYKLIGFHPEEKYSVDPKIVALDHEVAIYLCKKDLRPIIYNNGAPCKIIIYVDENINYWVVSQLNNNGEYITKYSKYSSLIETLEINT